ARATLKRAGIEAGCSARNQAGARLANRLGAGTRFRRAAPPRLLLRATLADEVSHHCEPGCDPDANLQQRIPTGLQVSHRVDEREPGAHRLHGIVLMRLRITEIGKNAVAHIARDDSLVAGDDLGDVAMKARSELAHVFRITSRTPPTQPDHIAQHPLPLPSLSTLPSQFDRTLR